jgi:hypothetical protein
MRLCCFIYPATVDSPEKQCQSRATWQAWDDPRPDGYIETCDDHLGHLLSTAPVHTVYPIPETL